MSASSHSVGKMSICETSASETLPPWKPPGRARSASRRGRGRSASPWRPGRRARGRWSGSRPCRRRGRARRARSAPRRRRGRASARWPCRTPCRGASRPCRAGSPAAASTASRAPRSARSTRGGSRRTRSRGRTAPTGARAIRRSAAGATGVDVVRLDVDDVVVAEHVGIAREVLLADQPRPVARVAQRPDQVVAVVVELEAAVGEPDHPVRVRPLARQQAGAATGAGRRGAERLPEQQPLIGEPLDVRRRHRMPVGLHVAAGVVGVDVEDVRLHSRPLTMAHPAV